MAISSSRMSKTLQRMLVRTQALVESGVIEQPKWLDAVRRSVANTLPLPPPPRFPASTPVARSCHMAIDACALAQLQTAMQAPSARLLRPAAHVTPNANRCTARQTAFAMRCHVADPQD